MLLITVLTLSIKSVSGNPKYSDTVTIDYFGKSYTIQLDKDIIRTSIRKITAEELRYVDSLHDAETVPTRYFCGKQNVRIRRGQSPHLRRLKPRHLIKKADFRVGFFALVVSSFRV
mgnify:CR=1 FL=1